MTDSTSLSDSDVATEKKAPRPFAHLHCHSHYSLLDGAGDIGRLVMEGLKQIDEVAYVRFASVYMDFEEAKDFERFLSNMEESGDD